ncbi:substrate-binding domain-containing protein [Sphaerimonospora mesophila]|uniref:substrate-binding domain-containing protein n=1 Tax=Sphaerimonospora mesophila TaxID=37483 RepID=UPI000A5122D6
MAKRYQIGLVIPLRGPGGIFGPSCEAVADLAAAHLNDNGGILGREVAIEVVDASGPPAELRGRIAGLLDAGRIDAITGWHISTVREHLSSVVADRVPYVYTSLYEGGESRRGIFCSGETPGLQVGPALSWLRRNMGLRRWAIVGSDYIWPRRTARVVRQYCRAFGLDLVEEIYVRYGTPSFAATLPRLEASGAEGVLMLMVGSDAVKFNRAFARRGLHERMVRFTPLMEENMLLASGADATENLFVAAGYFKSLATADALDLMSAYVERFGPGAPPLNNAAESCYEGIMALAALSDRARSAELSDIVRHSTGVGYEGPRGTMTISGGHTHQTVYLAAAGGYEFDVIGALEPMT